MTHDHEPPGLAASDYYYNGVPSHDSVQNAWHIRFTRQAGSPLSPGPPRVP
jgi:hypothetical protein